jgi:hypothetical protein
MKNFVKRQKINLDLYQEIMKLKLSDKAVKMLLDEVSYNIEEIEYTVSNFGYLVAAAIGYILPFIFIEFKLLTSSNELAKMLIMGLILISGSIVLMGSSFWHLMRSLDNRLQTYKSVLLDLQADAEAEIREKRLHTIRRTERQAS